MASVGPIPSYRIDRSNVFLKGLYHASKALCTSDFAAFAVEPGSSGLEAMDYFHACRRIGDYDEPAVMASLRIVAQSCIVSGRDDVVELGNSTQPGHRRFCLITLVHQKRDLIAAAGFIIHRRTRDEAHAALEQVRYGSEVWKQRRRASAD